MKRLSVVVVAAAALVLLPALASGAPTKRAADTDGVWVDGVVHNLVVTGPASDGQTAVPLYVIAPVSRKHPLHPLADALTHGFGAHDHVIELANPSTAFSGACDLSLVVPGRKAKKGKNVRLRATLTPAGKLPLLYAARLGKHILPLTAVSRIELAEKLKLAKVVDTQTLVACTITPRTTG